MSSLANEKTGRLQFYCKRPAYSFVCIKRHIFHSELEYDLLVLCQASFDLAHPGTRKGCHYISPIK
jgi:hypothetical protein